MSTKINTGARIHGIAGSKQKIAEILGAAHELAYASELQVTASEVVSFLDQVREQTGGVAGSRTDDGDEDPVYASIWTAVHEPSDTVALYIGGPSDVFTAALALAGVEDYSYWNNSDRPDNVTEAEWDARKLYWNEVIPGSWGMLRDTMTRRVVEKPSVDFTDPAVIAQIIEQVEPVNIRARRVASALGWNGDMSIVWSVLGPWCEDHYPALTPLKEAVLPLLPVIDAELIASTSPESSVTAERYPHLTPLIDAVRAELEAS